MSRRMIYRLTLVVLVVSGCSVGGQYGYVKNMVTVPASPPAEPVAANYSPDHKRLIDLIGPFVIAEFGKNSGSRGLEIGGRSSECKIGEVAGGTSDEYDAEYVVRAVHGCVIRGGAYWEKIQMSFTVTNSDRQIAVVVDGWLASSFSPPSDTQYTRSMQPTYADSLSTFSSELTIDLRRYISEAPEQR